MQDQYSKQHAEIARQIRLAKKRMFKAQRSGLPLSAAKDAFLAEVDDAITEQDFQARGNPPKDVRAAQAEATSDTGEIFTRSDLSTFTVDRLARIAHLLGIQTQGLSKADLISAIIVEYARDDEQDREESAAPQTYAPRFKHRDFGGYRILTDQERDHVCEHLGETLDGEHSIGLIFLLLEHLVACDVANDQGKGYKLNLEGEAITIRERLLAANHDAIDVAVDRLKKETMQIVNANIAREGAA